MNDKVWFPVSLSGAAVNWVETTRAHLSETAFLFEKEFTDLPIRSLPAGQVPFRPEAPLHDLQPRYIFHTAFCCSTLLARATFVTGKTLDLKEPDILMQLANVERNNPGQAKAFLETVEAGLFPAFVQSVVKPTNAANRLVELLMRHPNAKAVIIHSDLESFVLSIARKGEEGRSFVRRLFNILQLDDSFASSLPPRDVFTLSDLQIAGFVWGIQCAQLSRLQQLYPDKVRTIHCDKFLDQTEESLLKLAGFFDLEIDKTDVKTITQGALFSRNSKFPGQEYDASLRQDEQKAANDQFADSLDFVRDWVKKLPHPRAISGLNLI